MTANCLITDGTNTKLPDQNILERLNSWISDALEAVYPLLISDSVNQPKIIPRKNYKGEIFWKIEDPRTGKVYYCETEHDVLVWLESHLY